MAETSSNMIPLGTKAPHFCLLNPSTGKMSSLDELKSPVATVIMFICNHCPYVKLIKNKLNEVVKKYQSEGISFIGISSNDANKYPQDGPEKMAEEVEKSHLAFPYLYDETQEVAKSFQAACTPDFYIYDKNLLCVYRGRFDDSTPGNGKETTGKDLTQALDQILENKPISKDQKASLGCNIKWA